MTTNTTLGSNNHSVSEFKIVKDTSRPLVNVLRLDGELRSGTPTMDLGPVASDWYCTGKCKCPPNKISSIPENFPVKQPVSLALTGGANTGAGRVTFHSLDEFCEDKKKPQKPGGPGESNGDPHLTSLDGLHYDFQAAGEFTLARSTGGDLVVQERQQPYKDSKSVTINTQIAMLVAGHRVTVSPGVTSSDPPLVRVDGAETALAQGASQALGDGSVARELDGGYVDVSWSDGSLVVVRPVGNYGVAARVQLVDDRAGAVSGLLGDFDGNAGDDLTTSAGKRIPYHAKASDDWAGVRRFRVAEEFENKFFDDLYGAFANSWRITQAESQFDYLPGQTTDTFTDRSIPTRPVDPEELARAKRAKAEKICRAHGVTEPGPLADCITDVAATGDEAFAEDALAAQDASHAAWSRIGGGESRVGPLSLLEAPDGSLHVAFEERTGSGTRMLNVPLSASGGQGATETISSADSYPWLLLGADGTVRAEAPEIPSAAPSGIYEYGRSASGAWTNLGPVATEGFTYASRPNALYVDGTLFSVSPMAGVARVFRGKGAANHGVEPAAGAAGCYSSSPTLARDGSTGALWIAWLQWDCDTQGLFAVELDPATLQPIGTPQKAPGSTWTIAGSERYPSLSLDDNVAFTGIPGQAGVYLAFPANDGERVRLWKVGDAISTSVAKRRNPIDQVELAAEPSAGHLWLAWTERDRLWLRHTTSAGGLANAAIPVDPPRDSHAPLLSFHHWDVAARNGALDIVYGYRAGSENAGGLWRARVTG